VPSESTTAVGHSAWPCFRLHQPKLVMIYPLGFGACCKADQVASATGVGCQVMK
jgi:hypothetical protein